MRIFKTGQIPPEVGKYRCRNAIYEIRVLCIRQDERPYLLRKGLQNSNQDRPTGLPSTSIKLFLPPSCMAVRHESPNVAMWKRSSNSNSIPRSIIGVQRQDRITNARILGQTDTTSTGTHIVGSQLSWVGHVKRMPETWVPTQLLYAELLYERQPGDVWDGPPMGNQSRWPSLLATCIVYVCCIPWAETDQHGG